MLWALICLLLLEPTSVGSREHCRVSNAGSLHPVQGFLERFSVSPGCAARESGHKETHVISVGGEKVGHLLKQVTVVLQPLSLSFTMRHVTLVLSSQYAVSWKLEGDRLPAGLKLQLQMSELSDVQTLVKTHVKRVRELPWQPEHLLQWVLHVHSSISSLTHVMHGNRVYIHLGENPTLPSTCQLQSLFLSPSLLTSDLQNQSVRGCTQRKKTAVQVHVIHLRSAGVGLCGCLQVEVPVSLVPPVANADRYKLVLILSSLTPVTWAIRARGLQGHIIVYSSNSVSPLYASEPDLILTSVPIPNLHNTHILSWAQEHGYPIVSSYTEADVANRFVIKLTGSRTGPLGAGLQGLVKRRHIRDANVEPNVHCKNGILHLAVNTGSVKPVSMVTLSDKLCQGKSNGTHYLLTVPLAACGSESVKQEEPKGVQYKNTVLIWSEAETSNSETDEKPTPVSIPVSCVQEDPVADTTDTEKKPEPLILSMELYGTEEYKEREVGPCVLPAENRLYAQILVKSPLKGSLQIHSCSMAPHSYPNTAPTWPVIQSSCSVESTLQLSGGNTEVASTGTGEDGAAVEGASEHKWEQVLQGEMQVPRLRFSFVLHALHPNPMQFLHCNLMHCPSDSPSLKPTCPSGMSIPLLTGEPSEEECLHRVLYRPVLVTLPVTAASQLPPPAYTDTDTPTVVGVMFAAFLIGVALMGSLWCIYNRTAVTPPPGQASLLESVEQSSVQSPSVPLGHSSSSV